MGERVVFNVACARALASEGVRVVCNHGIRPHGSILDDDGEFWLLDPDAPLNARQAKVCAAAGAWLESERLQMFRGQEYRGAHHKHTPPSAAVDFSAVMADPHVKWRLGQNPAHVPKTKPAPATLGDVVRHAHRAAYAVCTYQGRLHRSANRARVASDGGGR